MRILQENLNERNSILLDLVSFHENSSRKPWFRRWLHCHFLKAAPPPPWVQAVLEMCFWRTHPKHSSMPSYFSQLLIEQNRNMLLWEMVQLQDVMSNFSIQSLMKTMYRKSGEKSHLIFSIQLPLSDRRTLAKCYFLVFQKYREYIQRKTHSASGENHF